MGKETMVSWIKTIGVIAAFVITLTTTVFLGGLRIGKTEKTVEVANEGLVQMNTVLRKHDEDIDTIKTEQAYQKGVIETKLNNLEVTITRIENMLMSWEPTDNN